MSTLLSREEALDRLLALVSRVGEQDMPVTEAAGRWLASDLVALRTQPEFPLSAMDGYALRFGELPGPFRVVGESAAGSPYDGVIDPGEAVRIFTGAALPEGADTILVQEEAGRDGDTLSLYGEGPPREGAHVRAKGEDFETGERLLETGVRLTPAKLGLAIAAGHDTLQVRRTVRVVVISTGDELKPPGVPLGPGEIPASNGPMLSALLAALPVKIEEANTVRDDFDSLREALADAAARADIIVTIGGASVGDHDLVRPALEAAGAEIDFWRIAVKPGKPLIAGRLGDAVVLGLPGNPVSAFVTAKLFLEPLIAKLGGAADPGPHFRMATLAEPLAAGGSRTEFLRGAWCDGRVSALDIQSSAMLSALAAAELLIERPIDAAPAAENDPVRILPLA